VAAIAWLLFVASFFLPATNVLAVGGNPPGTPLTGWQAFSSSIIAGPLNIWALIAEPVVLIFLIFPLANLLMLVAPLLIATLEECAVMLAPILIVCAAIVWLLPKELTGDLFVGFYCWNLSFLLMAAASVLSVGRTERLLEARRHVYAPKPV